MQPVMPVEHARIVFQEDTGFRKIVQVANVF